MKLQLVCESCGATFERYPSHAKSGKGKFCSFACKWTRNTIRTEGDTAYIEIRGRNNQLLCEAVIDAADVPTVKSYRWGAVWSKEREQYIARTTILRDGEHVSVLLHRFLLGLENSALVDHVDGDPLNNRRANLRAANKSQNGQNRKSANKNSRTGVRGVSPTNNGMWRARIMVNRRGVYIGTYPTIAEAEVAVIEARRKYMPHSTD